MPKKPEAVSHLSRRGLVIGALTSLLAAPSIVRASSLMKISGESYHLWQISLPILPPLVAPYDKSVIEKFLGPNGRPYKGTWTFFGKNHNAYSDQQIAFSQEEYPA